MNEDKLIRQPVGENTSGTKSIRPKIGKSLKLDATIYQEAHPDKKLMWIAENSTDLDIWLDNGAQPVPSAVTGRKTYKGLNDKRDSEWVRVVGGKTADGKSYYLYLLMIDPKTYDELKLAPERERQQEIEKVLRTGGNTSDLGTHLPGGGGIQTYAPNLPTGDGRGFNQIRAIDK